MPEYKPETGQVVELEEEKNRRFIEGQITEEEIKAHWANPGKPLFEHEIVYEKDGVEQKNRIRVRGLTEEYSESLLEQLKNSWDEGKDDDFLKNRFESADKGISGVFEKGDPTNYLFYYKKLRE